MDNTANFVVKIGDGYYARNSPWKQVEKSLATKLTWQQALRYKRYLRQPKIGYVASIEKVDG